MANENWKTGSGLIDEFDLTITEAYFDTNVKVQDGEAPILHLIGLNSVNGDPEDDTRFTVGKTFEIVEKGAKVVPINPKGKLNRNSQYGKFVDAFLACEDSEALLESRDMDPFVAESWIGLTLSLERVVTPTTIKGEKVDMTSWIVHSAVETEAKAKGRKKAAAKKPAEKAPEEPKDEAPADEPEVEAPAAAAAEDTGTEIPAKFAAAARGIAKASDTHEAFVNSVYEDVAGILNEPWENEIVSVEFYTAARED